MKKLGQHFLKNKSAIKKIVAALELENGDVVVEIGPGHGELTRELLAFSFEVLGRRTGAIKIIVVEKDEKLSGLLQEKYTDNKNIEVIRGDILKILLTITKSYNLKPKSWKLVGNIPYYITGHLLRVVGDLKNKPSLCVLMLQKEVAERLTAGPPQTNRLAASVRFWAEPIILARVPREDFSPPPEVDSAIIKLSVKGQTSMVNGALYYSAVRMLFAQPRKTILNNLAAGLGVKNQEGEVGRSNAKEILSKIGLAPNSRPHDLTVEDIAKIAQLTNDYQLTTND